MPNDASDLRLSASLPATPGSLWALLAKLSWSDPDIVRAHTMVLRAFVQSAAAAAAGGLSTDGTATDTQPNRVVAHRYFLVRRITGSVESDPGAAVNDSENSNYVSFNVTDQERQYSIFRDAIRMRSLAGTRALPGIPIEYDEFPLVFLPNANILGTFTPLSGLSRAGLTTRTEIPAGGGAAILATTRICEVQLHGALVAESIVDNLIEQNAAALAASGLNQRGREKR